MQPFSQMPQHGLAQCLHVVLLQVAKSAQCQQALTLQLHQLCCRLVAVEHRLVHHKALQTWGIEGLVFLCRFWRFIQSQLQMGMEMHLLRVAQQKTEVLLAQAA